MTHPCTITNLVRHKVPFEPPAPKVYTLEDVLHDTCLALDIPVYRVAGKTRKREVVICRFIYCYVAKRKTSRSLLSIGSPIGHRDHTTVMAALRVVRNLFDSNNEQFLSDWNRYLQNSKLFNKYDFK